MNYYIIIPVACSAVLSFFLVYILAQRRPNPVNRTFFWFMTVYALWILSYKFIWLPLPDATKMPLLRLQLVLWFATSYLFLRFVYVFAGRRFDAGYYAHTAVLAVAGLLSVFSGMMLSGFRHTYWGTAPLAGPLFAPGFVMCFVMPVLHASVMGLRELRGRELRVRRRQLVVLVTGTVVSGVFGTFMAVLEKPLLGTAHLYPFFPLTSLLHAGFVFWAVRRYNFLTVDRTQVAHLFDALFDESQEGIVIVDGDDAVLRMNRAARRFFGIRAADALPRSVASLLPQRGLVPLWHEQCITVASPDGPRALLLSSSPFRSGSRSESGRILFFHDVTEQSDAERQLKEAKAGLELRVRARTAELLDANDRLTREIRERMRAEERMGASLREKEVLLQEVHHRVKNNLQIISSLLNLQARQVRDDDDRALFLESQGRIRSIALIHEKLYRSRNVASVEVGPYVRDLVAKLRQSYLHETARVDVVLDVAEASLPLDTAIPCGLIVNELVSNAFKYAFPAGGAGELRVSFSVVPGGTCALTVADDGIGMPAGMDPAETDTLGLQLVSTLAQQLDGAVVFGRGAGTMVTVTFAGRTHDDRGAGAVRAPGAAERS